MLLEYLRSDIDRYRTENSGWLSTIIKALYTHPSFLGVLYYRIERSLWTHKRNPISFILFIFTRFLYPIIRIYSGLEISPKAQIGKGFYVGHFGPTVIHPDTIAGDQLTIMHGCTIGSNGFGVPVISDNVSIGTGAALLGGIHIGKNVLIGPGAVITTDVEEGTAISIPTRIIKTKKE
jgi:serine O-acetyltransferase